jgi:hypothetical protein
MWSREPVRREVHIRLDKKSQKHQLTGDGPGVYLQAEVRGQVLELSLVNAQDEPPAHKDTAWLFQPKLTVTAAGDEERAVFAPIDDPHNGDHETDDAEERHLRLLYRDILRHAVGRNVATHAHVRQGERSAFRLETDWLPSYEVPATIAPALENVELSMADLAEVAQQEIAAKLTPLVDGYAIGSTNRTTTSKTCPSRYAKRPSPRSSTPADARLASVKASNSLRRTSRRTRRSASRTAPWPCSASPLPHRLIEQLRA